MSLSDLPAYLDLAIMPIARFSGAAPRAFAQTVRSPFRAADASTFRLLQKELDHLDATDRALFVCVDETQFRRDGRPSKNAVTTSPGVVLEFTSRGQTFAYVADRFSSQMENLRAIALTLEHLRAVDRYGLTGDRQQYAGFLAIEAATVEPEGFATADDAYTWLLVVTGSEGIPGRPKAAMLLRKAQRIAHPDMGGDPYTFQRVALAESVLRKAGEL